jgi:tRNA pseudouridine(38-40) synthase
MDISCRNQINDFIYNRDWTLAKKFWFAAINQNDFKIFDENTSKFSHTDISLIHNAGWKGEYFSKDDRYAMKQNYAARIGYLGTEYYGYQKQKTAPGKTVEEDVKSVLGYKSFCAGRTDREVSAISQVICFSSNQPIDTIALLESTINAEPCVAGRLKFYDIKRVPKKFHARSSATWRRYLYLFPLNSNHSKDNNTSDIHVNENVSDGNNNSTNNNDSFNTNKNEKANIEYDFDVDVAFLNKILSKLVFSKTLFFYFL